jgi:hypothetical protein
MALNLLKSFSRALYTNMIPIRAANASSVNLVKYRTTEDPSVATIIRQNKVDLKIKAVYSIEQYLQFRMTFILILIIVTL